MADKAVPEYMKRYMENIGENSFTDYDSLSKQYHKSIQIYHELKFPSRISPTGRPFFKQDVSADLQRIEEQFKARALDIACEKHGYKDPGYDNYDKDLTTMQEDGSYNGLSKDHFGLSAEDIRAKKAHEIFEKENPDKTQYKEGNRAIIDYYYSGPDGPAQRDENRSKALLQKWQHKTIEKEPHKPLEKESRSKEENQALAKGFTVSGKDITQSPNRYSMSGRFFMSLPSDPKPPEPGKNALSKDMEEIEMDRDY